MFFCLIWQMIIWSKLRSSVIKGEIKNRTLIYFLAKSNHFSILIYFILFYSILLFFSPRERKTKIVISIASVVHNIHSHRKTSNTITNITNTLNSQPTTKRYEAFKFFLRIPTMICLKGYISKEKERQREIPNSCQNAYCDPNQDFIIQNQRQPETNNFPQHTEQEENPVNRLWS